MGTQGKRTSSCMAATESEGQLEPLIDSKRESFHCKMVLVHVLECFMQDRIISHIQIAIFKYKNNVNPREEW
jgi:hypothetical protein